MALFTDLFPSHSMEWDGILRKHLLTRARARISNRISSLSSSMEDPPVMVMLGDETTSKNEGLARVLFPKIPSHMQLTNQLNKRV